MTQNELFEIYLKEEWYEIFTFEEFEKHWNKVKGKKDGKNTGVGKKD